jgi:hypothetical protein
VIPAENELVAGNVLCTAARVKSVRISCGIGMGKYVPVPAFNVFGVVQFAGRVFFFFFARAANQNLIYFKGRYYGLPRPGSCPSGDTLV